MDLADDMDDKQRIVLRAYDQLKQMAETYHFKPDSRLNEGALAKELNISRTPLREALNRLVAEGYIVSRSGKGFFCRSLSPNEIMDLYEARAAIESEVARLAALRGKLEDVAEIGRFLESSKPSYQRGTPPVELVRLDEEFHLRLASLAGNAELRRLLENVNGRIHYVRLIDLMTLCDTQSAEVVTTEPHMKILDAVRRRDPEAAQRQMRSHIDRRLEAVTQTVRNAFAELYAP